MTLTNQDKEILAASRGTVRDRRRTPRLDSLSDIIREFRAKGVYYAEDVDALYDTGEDRAE